MSLTGVKSTPADMTSRVWWRMPVPAVGPHRLTSPRGPPQLPPDLPMGQGMLMTGGPPVNIIFPQCKLLHHLAFHI